MPRPVIYSTHGLHDAAMADIGEQAEVRVATALDEETLAREGRVCDVVIVRAPLPEAMFAEGTMLRAAIRHGAGIDMIPADACTRAGVLVANVPGANATTVAEHVIMSALMLLRRHRMVERDLRGSGWLAAREHSLLGHDLGGRSMGFVGMGAVGRATAALAQAFGAALFAHTPSGAGFPAGVTALALDDLLAGSDIVVLCCPLTPVTRGLIDARRIGLMKKDALLINVSRGPVVDEAALASALRTGALAGAALDVFEVQPLPAQSPLPGMANVILTPHMAGITDESMARMGRGAAAEALRVLAGGLPVNLLNPAAVALYRRRFP